MKRLTWFMMASALLIPATHLHAAQLGITRDELELSAAQGDPKAQTELAIKYENAEGVPKDFDKANGLYCDAAREGYAEAQFRLGWAYANGRGVARDDGVAAVLFRMAAKQGHEYAARLLRYVHEQPAPPMPSCLNPAPAVTNAPYEGAAFADPVAITGVRSEIEQLVRRLAPEYAVDSQLVLAVISAESAFDPSAVSPKQAQGLMQLIPETAARFGVKHAFNPVENIRGGLAYLRWLLAFFQGNVPFVLAAYNAGERAVEQYRGIPPYAETRNYVRRITSVYKQTQHPYDAAIVDPSPIMESLKRGRR